MTLFLAMDTATDFGSVAIGMPGEVFAEIELPKRRFSAELMPAVLNLLQQAGGDLAGVTGIVVADGPGSFTGLRISFATAKGMLRESPSTELYTIPSLLGTAYGTRQHHDGPVAVLYDALRGDVFGAVYEFQHGAVICHLAPTLGTVEALRDKCSTRPVLAVGDGALLHPEQVRAWCGRAPLGPPDAVPSGSSLLHLLALDGAVRRVEDPVSIEPYYGRLAEAQVRLEQARGE